MINLTPEEQFRFYGAIHGEQAEQLLDGFGFVEDLADLDSEIKEGMGQFTNEGFLDEIVTDLETLVKRMRGDNRQELDRIIKALEEIAMQTNQSAEYGREKLEDVIAKLPPK